MALTEFQTTANVANNEFGAEAAYRCAYILYLKNEYKETEKSIFAFINREPSYPYWMTKGLLLLADNYAALKDDFQAKHTLKSIIESSDITELVKIAQDKLDRINELEKLQVPKLSSEDLKVEFKENKIDYTNLFKETEDKKEAIKQ